MDSAVLLHLAQQTGWPVQVVHIHHGLQPQADAWAAHVKMLAKNAQLPCHVVKIQPNPDEGGLEAGARKARYAALKAFLEPGDCLLTAHHADDQVETLWLRILRGTGPMGLIGIRHCQPFGAGYLLRPLLDVPYQALRQYAQCHQLSWMDDPSNQDTSFERNYLRHQVVPLLKARWPSMQQTMGRLARLTEETEGIFSELLSDRIGQHRLADAPLLAVNTLIQESRAMRFAIVREWLAELGWRPPSRRQLDQGLDDLLFADDDRQPVLKWADGQLARFNGALYRLPNPLPAGLRSAVIRRGETCSWGQVGTVHWVSTALPEQGDLLEMRPFSPGDRVYLPQRPPQAAKELLRQARVPPWWRSQLPFITNSASEVVAIAGVVPSAAFEFIPNADPALGDWRYFHGSVTVSPRPAVAPRYCDVPVGRRKK